MPARTINDTFFVYADAAGITRHALRGETVDVPEGDDLKRGDTFGAFTAEVGDEPPAVEESFIPKIEADWSAQEYQRWVDSGKINEILEHLDAVAPSDRPRVAQNIIDAEHGRSKPRARLLQALASVATGSGDIVETNDGEEDLTDYVESNNIPTIVARAEADSMIVDGLLAAEQARGDEARKSLIEQLTKLNED